MSGYVLVHGGNMSTETWNRLTIGEPVATPDGTMGGRIWDPVIPALDAEMILAPDLGDEQRCDLTSHVDQVVGLITTSGMQDVVLAAHSYGGMVITGVAARIPHLIAAMAFVDAALPDPGQSLFAIIESSGVDPLSFPGLEPAPPYVEPLQFDAALLAPIPKTYVLCTRSDFAAVTRLARNHIEQQPAGWTFVDLPTGHVPMATMPNRVAAILRSAGGTARDRT